MNDDSEKVWKLGNEFYQEYGKLVAKYLSKAPVSLRQEMEDSIQDKSNIYGSCYKDYLNE